MVYCGIISDSISIFGIALGSCSFYFSHMDLARRYFIFGTERGIYLRCKILQYISPGFERTTCYIRLVLDSTKYILNSRGVCSYATCFSIPTN